MSVDFTHRYVEAAQECGLIRFGKDAELESALFDADVSEMALLEKSGIQSSCSVANVRKARRLATLFVSDTGELLLPKIKMAKALLEQAPYSLQFGGEEERLRDQHFLKALSFLADTVDAQRMIKKMSRPLSNRLAENAIRDTLLLPENELVNDTHVRRAVVASLLTLLRQSLGSCFATAPAILVQAEQPLLFLHDLDELMSTAKLRRTVAGNEYSVPMSSSWGLGDLKKPLLLSWPLSSSQPLWQASTFLATLKEIGVLPPEDNQEAVYELLEQVTAERIEKSKWMLTNVDELITWIILAHLGLKEADVETFLHRPKALVQTGVVITQREGGSRASQDKVLQRFFALHSQANRFFAAQADCALLKSWEFTIASFAEVKFDLCRWNFYSSLGINWDDVGGIGNILYEIAKNKVDETNRELELHKEKYDAISLEVDYLARRLQQASTEAEIQWLKVEYQARQVEQYNIQQLCDMATEKANKIAHVHQFLIDKYDVLMKEYFQEIYDADLQEVQAGPFDDSPAGFRLIYKHGRSNPSLWTKISSMEEYVEALVSFFTITEQELLHAPEIKGIEADFSAIITRLANHVRSDEFLESAFTRTAVAHGVQPIQRPLQNLEKIEKKPWVYTSGGSMNTLVSAYFGLEGAPEEADRWVENENELLAYLIDTTRLAMARAGRYKPQHILMHSPTHAFSLLPLSKEFEEAWAGDAYSYTWIKYHLVNQGVAFYTSCVLDQQSVAAFCERLAAHLPEEIQKRFLNESSVIPGFLRPFDLAQEIETLFRIDTVLRHYTQALSNISLSGLLYEAVPYTSREALREMLLSIVSTVLSPKECFGAESVIEDLTRAIYKPVCVQELLLLIKTAILLMTKKSRFEKDVWKNVLDTMRSKRILAPRPLFVADSNWVKDVFAFTVSPVTQQVELWSMNAYGTEGKPISNWKMWLDGSRRDRKWGLLINPSQYRAFFRNSSR